MCSILSLPAVYAVYAVYAYKWVALLLDWLRNWKGFLYTYQCCMKQQISTSTTGSSAGFLM